MAVNLSPDVEREIERLLPESGFETASDLVRSALDALKTRSAAFWARVERLDAEADEDVREGRYRPVTDEFLEQLRAIVTRPKF